MVYLGCLTVKQIEERYGFEFTEEQRFRLMDTMHRKAEFEDGETGWHMFDIPEFLAISKGDIGNEVLAIFQSHNEEIHGSISVGYANKTEKKQEEQ